MKDLMKTNCYDIGNNIIIIGSCLPKMQPNAYEELKKMLLIFFSFHFLYYLQ